ncbi:MAG: Npun_F0494 family protein [Elainellaceae cyanobacterium]
MTSASNKRSPSIQYSPKTVVRAERSLRCAPFTIQLFETMRWQSVELSQIAGMSGVQNGYTGRSLSELAAESDLLWLIQTGLLRREVDGQGITDSFRLTPLGHQIVETWRNQEGGWSEPSWLDRLYDALSRWGRLPMWLQ